MLESRLPYAYIYSIEPRERQIRTEKQKIKTKTLTEEKKTQQWHHVTTATTTAAASNGLREKISKSKLNNHLR